MFNCPLILCVSGVGGGERGRQNRERKSENRWGGEMEFLIGSAFVYLWRTGFFFFYENRLPRFLPPPIFYLFLLFFFCCFWLPVTFIFVFFTLCFYFLYSCLVFFFFLICLSLFMAQAKMKNKFKKIYFKWTLKDKKFFFFVCVSSALLL